MNALHKAEALVEALDYFRAFRKKIVVVKLGGSIMDDSSCLTSTLADLVLMETAGMFPVLVHGGGKAIDQAMAKQGLQPKKIAGRRITDDDTLAIVREVLTNDTNADIVRRIRNLGGRAIPLHTGAMQVLWGKKWLLPNENGFTDLGHVGIVDKVDNNLISDFISAGVIPVIPSLAVDDKNSWLNVNADTAACAVAMSLKAEKLVFLSDTPGILRDRKDPSSLITSLNQKDCQELIKQGIIDSGMIPKVEACLDSLQKGVGKTHMIDGRQKHSLLLEIFTKQGTGTEITLN